MKKLFLSLSLLTVICSSPFSQETPDSVRTAITSADTTVTITAEPVATYSIDRQRQSVYKIKPWVDIPLTVATVGYSLYGMSVIYGRDKIPQSEIDGLKREDVNKFDRSVIDNYSESAKNASDMLFYGSMPLPIFLMLDKKIRKDGLKVGLLYLEAMGITGTLYTTSAMLADRYRPYAYNKNAPAEDRVRGGARNSFFAGHPAVVATSVFFMAKVYTDYHPDMKGKWILYTLAGGAAITTGMLRIAAGQHFRTDVITGVLVGSAVGVLVPHFHKNKLFKGGKLALYPNIQPGGSNGLTAILKL